MARYVFKFGGTSVGSAERIKVVAEKVKQAHSEGHEIIVVVSAMSGETNRLTALAGDLLVNPNPREMDVLLSTGEQVTIALLSMALDALGCLAESFTGGQVEILTDSVHSKARIKDIGVSAIQQCLASGKVAVVAGFQGVNEQGHITTLGRGGSDTTAVALAAKLKASECHIYTDVDGVYTTDPRVEPTARKMNSVTFEEMLEMASLGSKVLQIRAVEFAGKYNVPLRVLSTFSEGSGTLITYEDDGMERALISGIAFNRDEAKLTINGVPDLPGVASKIVGPIAANNIEIDMIIQNIADDETTDFTFTVHRNDYVKALAILEEIKVSLSAKKVSGDDTIVKVSLVGVGMRSHSGIASKMFEVLAAEGINIKMISTSEIKISVVMDEKYLELAVRALHKSFDLAEEPTL
ncbi:MAG: aspartate kinase [Methylococcales bacterium]|jgi:aspartate kinase|nr:aspartate kinase [Methylococcales bacterium]MBT3816157.1 aspartate kinase [Methylococcales bacterium]MBT4032593.1 aspartate kinase [Methylococcales bacterium]MBT4347386.1 aspartate kinase [Methylococcales bacterium]MBT7576022.1 aspartate kinase [Methylococcales bacterium]